MVSITAINWLKNLSHGLAEALLPQDCLVCGQRQDPDTEREMSGRPRLLCAACVADLPRLAFDRCPVCALPTPGGQVCGPCLKTPPEFDASLALYEYAFPVDQLIQSLKYQHRLALADWFGADLADMVAASGVAAPDLILPMPLHAKRLAERGFDQAVELARPLAARLHRPLALNVVERIANAPPQASLPWKARRKNIRGAFLCQQDLTGREVWVIDDVMTTGATLNELARVLKNRGARRVVNVVVARTLHHV